MEVNKSEAERCRDMGAVALRQGNYARAVKLLHKSLQLYPLPGVEALVEQAKRQQAQNASSNGQSTSSSTPHHHRTAPPQRSSSSPPPQSTSSTRTDPPQRSESTGADGRTYTEEQVKIVQKVLKARQGGRGAHYRVLGLETTCTELEIKKAYRKLSLKVHPDKNAAPHADEAFKAVGLAYATLSDGQKRTIYDRYGEEDPDSRGGGGGGGMRPRRGGGVHMHGQQVDPDEIFNMFFGGGMQGGGMPGGMHFYSTGFGPGMHFQAGGPRRRAAPPRGQAGPQQEQPAQANWNVLFQLLPIILMMLLSFGRMGGDDGNSASYMPGVDKYFSLTHNPPFTNPLATKLSKVKDIPYFVSDKFLRTYHRDRYQLGQVERMVERAYEQYLVDECTKQSNYKANLSKKASREKDPAVAQSKAQQAASFELTRCMELDDLFPDRRKQKQQRHRSF